MPEGPEIRIMSDYINNVTKNKNFINAFHVEKGNLPKPFLDSESPSENFQIESDYYGKKLIIYLISENERMPIYIFMGMSGAIKYVETSNWDSTKYTRLRLDNDDGFSLLLYGGYLGPKYSIFKNFDSANTGPDIIKEFDNFESNVFKSLDNKTFQKPIYEVLLDQKYFAGVGNYLRSTIIYYADVNPFSSTKEVIENNPNFLKICYEIMQESYQLNGGQLKDWSNPFNVDSDKFDNWVFYKKGESIKDKQGRTFWYNPKWTK